MQISNIKTEYETAEAMRRFINFRRSYEVNPRRGPRMSDELSMYKFGSSEIGDIS